jgi:hypothetical protein
MSMGKREGKQESLWIGVGDMPRSAGHRFYEKLNELLGEADFDRKAEALCAPFYEPDGTLVGTAGRVLSDALHRVLRRHRVGAGHRVAV